MLDLDREEYLPIREAAKLIRSARKPNKCIDIGTIRRWIQDGLRGKRLESYKIGGSLYTTAAALQRFIVETNDGRPAPPVRASRDPVRLRRTKLILNRERLSANPKRADSGSA